MQYRWKWENTKFFVGKNFIPMHSLHLFSNLDMASYISGYSPVYREALLKKKMFSFGHCPKKGGGGELADSPAVFRFIFVMKHSRRWWLNISSFQEIPRFRIFLVSGNSSFQEFLVSGFFSFEDFPEMRKLLKSRKLLQRRLSPELLQYWIFLWFNSLQLE